MSNDKKVEVVKLKTTVPFNWYFNNYGDPKEIDVKFSSDPYIFVKCLSQLQSLLQNQLTKGYVVANNTDIYVVTEVVLYDAIKDYAMYQPELEFKDDESI